MDRTGDPAVAMLHARFSLEAGREPACTTLGIEHIAWR
jgi:hypothetical protein